MVPLPPVSSDFWRVWHREFQDNDGSLPEVRLLPVADEHLQLLWTRLTAGVPDAPAGHLWRSDLSRELTAEEVPEAGALVAAGSVDFFHVVLRRVHAPTGALCDIGVFFAPGEVALDYQPGPDWNEEAFEGLLGLLRELHALAPECAVTTEEGAVDEYRDAFEQAFAAFEAPFLER